MIFLRSLLFNVWFFAVTLVLSLYATVLWRLAPRRLDALVRLWAHLLGQSARLICGIRLVVIGREHLAAAGPLLIAAEHQSAFDTFVWFTLLPRPAYVVKQELLRIPVLGALLRPAGMIVVDRDGGASTLRGLLRDTAQAAAAGRPIVIFPEGTRVEYGMQVPLQPGVAAIAAHSRLPVVPVATDSGRRWGRRSFLKRPGTIHIVIGAPLPPDLRRDALLARIRSAWQEAAMQFRAVDNSVGENPP